ncbi:MAG: triose-phosphate isomerase [Parcubacteria bacterium C7867-004]|nr:MAG: triose-phosphate isomerase [Parcubacteria bacterium C7867-004]
MLIVGNWKAYVESSAKAKALYAGAKRLSVKGKHEIVIAPSYPYIGMLAGGKAGPSLASQDVSVTTGGAATGEVAAGALKELGVEYVIVGHSERRAQGETDADITEKARHALAHGMTPILCVGETERDSEAQYLKGVRAQISAVMEKLTPKERLTIVIAYEPVWAIGKTGSEAITPSDLGEMILYIRKVLADFVPGRANMKVPVIYGGSVDPLNIRSLASGTGVEGFLVGRASTDVATFSSLVKALS